MAQVQDELYSMLGILNPDRGLHRSRSEMVSPGSASRRCHSISGRPSNHAAAAAAAAAVAVAGAGPESPRKRGRTDSLPGAMSLTEAYNVMSVDVSLFFLAFFLLTILTYNFFFFL